MRFVSITESGSKVRKTMKTADNVALENAVYLWFIQQRRLHVPMSVEETVQTEEIQLAPLINQLQNSNPISNPEALQWTVEADDSLARNEILADDEIIRTATAEDDDDDDDTPINSVKFLILRLWRHSILQYSGLKSKILKYTKLCSSDV
ncbi:hypothetical protein J437_LFUL010690 [Ladona fulva]|uniref:Uncharacterized protein n=1 Tax=Ladona fulva TaxID=123851 RepID=A0A8K0P0E0_LADFU|nr:hypothetical protein J437_LFUL010690 [Ladona fulva]